ncbi:MAG: sensor domain-containing diguanylate cyclase [Alphaproteobacteria bacterium]|nr:sensor domain-containing diguanylate cyclase [Alphaproteobacteria bacterium]
MPKHVYKKHTFPCSLPLDEGVLPHLTSAVFEVAHQPMVLLDSVGRIRSANRAFFQMLGLREDTLNNQPFSMLFEEGKSQDQFRRFFKDLLANAQWEGNLTHRKDDGHLINMPAYFFGVDYPKDSFAYFIGFYHTKDHLSYAMDFKPHERFDPLTDLQTTPLFIEKMTHSLDLAKKRHESLTVFYMDLYQMSHFNQTYGLTHGDLLLKRFAKAMLEALPGDALFSRVGGDAFAFVLHNSYTQEDTHSFIEEVLTTVEEHTHFRTDLSMPILHIGAASYPDSAIDAKKLFEYAKHSSDLARAKPQTNIVYHKTKK